MVSSNFPPVTGGSAAVYDNICKFSGGAIVALAPSRDYLTGKSFHDIAEHDAKAGYRIYRTDLLRPSHVAAGKRSTFKSLWGDLRVMFNALVRVAAIVRSERIRVACIGDLVYGGWLIFPLRRLLGCKVVVYVHGEEITTEDSGGLFDAWRKRFLDEADAVVCVSRFTRAALIDVMSTAPSKIEVLPNGVDTERFQVRAPAADAAARYGVAGRRVLLSVGRLVPRKGTDHLVQAMEIVTRTHPEVHLLIAGEGALRATLADLISTRGLGSSVTLLGAVTDEALAELYALADIFTLPNRRMPDGDTEGFGLVFLEANACGKPVIAGQAGGATDAVADGVNGLTVDGADVSAIAAAIIRLIEQPALCQSLARSGLDLAARSDWRNRSTQFLALCDALTAHGRRSFAPQEAGLST
jgi:phosphatidylinositol alpha-1,6-mannosyltransferase